MLLIFAFRYCRHVRYLTMVAKGTLKPNPNHPDATLNFVEDHEEPPAAQDVLQPPRVQIRIGRAPVSSSQRQDNGLHQQNRQRTTTQSQPPNVPQAPSASINPLIALIRRPNILRR
jgi:hypothetical protein